MFFWSFAPFTLILRSVNSKFEIWCSLSRISLKQKVFPDPELLFGRNQVTSPQFTIYCCNQNMPVSFESHGFLPLHVKNAEVLPSCKQIGARLSLTHAKITSLAHAYVTCTCKNFYYVTCTCTHLLGGVGRVGGVGGMITYLDLHT